MPLSNDPSARQKQLANLKTTAATTHGAQSEQAIRPLRERFVVELSAAFPSATKAEVAIQAQRLAQLELLGAFLDEFGVIRHRRRGDVFPAAAMAERIAANYERRAAVLLERERVSGSSGTDLETYLRETYGDGQEGGSDAS